MMSTKQSRRLSALLLSTTLACTMLVLSGCGDSSPPNEDVEPEPEQPMSQGPMSDDDAGDAPSDEL